MFNDLLSNRFVDLFILTPILLGSGICIGFFYDDLIHKNFFIIIAANILAILMYVFLLKLSNKNSQSYNVLMILYFIFLITLGCALMKLRILSINYVNLDEGIYNVKGKVDLVQDKKLLLKNLLLNNKIKVHKIKISVKNGLDRIEEGDIIEFQAKLFKPASSALPGGFDYQRYAFFKNIEAVGYITSDIIVLKSEKTLISCVRQIILKSFYDHLDKDKAAIAVALFLGNSKKINEEIYSNIRDAGIAHLFAISGMHITLVVTIVFYSINSIFNMVRDTTFRLISKKIAAIITVLFAFFYLIISGVQLSAQRAFLMAAVILLGVVIDRKTCAKRTVVIAMVTILCITPEALLSPSLQMSLSACLALIYGYHKVTGSKFLRFLSGENLFLKVISYLLLIIITSVLATLATSVFVMYHFKKFPVYSVLTNLLAIPITEFVIMPFGILGIVFKLINLEFIPYTVMGVGIKLLLFISNSISGLPNSTFYIYSINSVAFVSYIFGFLSLLVFKEGYKSLSCLFFIFFLYFLLYYVHPSIVVDSDIVAAQLHNNSEDLYFIKGARKKYIANIWKNDLGVKKASYQEKSKICNQGYCALRKYNAYVVFERSALDVLCNDNPKFLINLTGESCPDYDVINIKQIEQMGSHMIWISKEKIFIKNRRSTCKILYHDSAEKFYKTECY